MIVSGSGRSRNRDAVQIHVAQIDRAKINGYHLYPVCNRSYPAVCAEANTETANIESTNKLFNTNDLVNILDSGFFIEFSLLEVSR